MRLVVRREDLPTRIAPFVQKAAETLVDAAPGRLDVVKELGDVVPVQFVGDYIGTPTPEGNVFAPQSATISAYLFLPVGDFRDKALEYGKAMRTVLTSQIARRKQQRGARDDVLERCLVMQDAGMPGMDDKTLLNNLFGMVVAIIPTTSAAVAKAIDELLRRPEQLAGAQAAAQAGDTKLVTQYVYEALRFNPLGPGVFRNAAQDFEVAGGTSHATTIPAGRPVLVALQSASFDGDRVASPHEFQLDRPLPEYLHYGFGLHTCFGRYINAVQIPLIVQAVLRKRNLRRAAGEAGKLQVDGPFPSSLTVEFDA
jgi:cytochrome P450